MMNNKHGQVLIVFLLLLPILLMFMGLITDMGYNYMEKRKMDDVVKDTIKYAFDHLEEDRQVLRDDMNNLLTKNISDIKENDIIIDTNLVKISLSKENEGLFGKLLNKKLYQISSSYYGYMDNGKLKIIEE